jgi:transposase
MPSPPSTRPNDARGRRSSAFVREDSGTATGTQRPDALYADRGYDHDKYRKQAREAGIKPVIARRGEQYDSGLGVNRWVVEQGFALLHWFRRLRIRSEIRDDIYEAFLRFACAIICWRRLHNISNC